MKTFLEYYEDRLAENWAMDMADRLLSRYAAPKTTSAPRSFTQPDRTHFSPATPATSHEAEPDENDVDKYGIRYNPGVHDDPTDVDPEQDWASRQDIRASNVVDLNDQDFRELVRSKIRSIMGRVKQPAQIFDILSEDPEIRNYLSRIKPAQRSAFTRLANQEFQRATAPLKVRSGPGVGRVRKPAMGLDREQM